MHLSSRCDNARQSALFSGTMTGPDLLYWDFHTNKSAVRSMEICTIGWLSRHPGNVATATANASPCDFGGGGWDALSFPSAYAATHCEMKLRIMAEMARCPKSAKPGSRRPYSMTSSA